MNAYHLSNEQSPGGEQLLHQDDSAASSSLGTNTASTLIQNLEKVVKHTEAEAKVMRLTLFLFQMCVVLVVVVEK